MAVTATASADEIAAERNAGRASSAELLEPFLGRIAAYEPQVLSLVDRRTARTEAMQEASGVLAGVPVTIKDVIDTCDLPTQHGSPIYAGNRPQVDAPLVGRLRAAGATILGKAVTAEFAIRTPRETRNPHDLERTPGGSSSGSASSVASGFATVSIGTQTTASTIRPASFCGVFGLKPTHGSISLDGVFVHSHTMDTVGIFARHADDLGRTLRVIASSHAIKAMRMQGLRRGPVAASRTLGVLRVPDWSGLDAECAAVLVDALDTLRERWSIVEVVPPDEMDRAWSAQPIVHHVESAVNLDNEYRNHREQLSPQLVDLIEQGQRELHDGYEEALRALMTATAAADRLFATADLLIMPCASDVAPIGLARSGGAEFGRLASATGLPAVAVPGLRMSGLPFGLQVIGPRHSDLDLVDAAGRIAEVLGHDPSVFPAMTPSL